MWPCNRVCAAINNGFDIAEEIGLAQFVGQNEVEGGAAAARALIARGVTKPVFIEHGTPPNGVFCTAYHVANKVPCDSPAWAIHRFGGFNKTFVEELGIHPKWVGANTGDDVVSQKNVIKNALFSSTQTANSCPVCEPPRWQRMGLLDDVSMRAHTQ